MSFKIFPLLDILPLYKPAKKQRYESAWMTRHSYNVSLVLTTIIASSAIKMLEKKYFYVEGRSLAVSHVTLSD